MSVRSKNRALNSYVMWNYIHGTRLQIFSETKLIWIVKRRWHARLLHKIVQNLPRGPERGFGRCLLSRVRCHYRTAAAWSGNVSVCSAGGPRRWLAAAGLPAMRKRKRTVRCCNAAVEMALHSGLVGNDDSHWSLKRKEMKRGEIKMIPLWSWHMSDHVLKYDTFQVRNPNQPKDKQQIKLMNMNFNNKRKKKVTDS